MKFKLFLFIILFINIFSINTYSQSKDMDDLIRVGIYENEPYYSIDSNGNVKGYYHELLLLLQEKYKFKYEYVVNDFDDGMKDLEDGKIDIMFGISITPERIDSLVFNKYFIDRDRFALLTNKDIKFSDLAKLDGLKIGLVEGITTSNTILEFFSATNINIDTVFVKTFKEMENLLKENKVDIIFHNNYQKGELKSLYEIEEEPVYIAANKNKSDILENIDKAIIELSGQSPNRITELYNSYFNEEYKKMLLQKKILIIVLTILILLIITFLMIPKIKKNNIKNKIRFRMNKDKYLLQYQPIYNPRTNNVVGFEGLLRLLDENNKLIPPYKFIPEIEKNDMLFEVSLWILEKVINDYNEIKYYECVRDKEFYISLNLSLNEIENDKFIKRATDILNKSNLGHNKICLEIIERVKMKELDKITENISILKDAGFKIAIDDFGVEYSNLDILHRLDTDVIKVDKHFVDGIDKDTIRNEIILFISRIAKAKDKAVVLEGVEEEKQDTRIKEIENDKIYVQGYFYNRPMYKDDIKEI